MVENLEMLPAAQTHKIDSKSICQDMAENHPNTLYVLSTDKAELHIQDIKSVVRGGQKNRKYWNLRAVVMSDVR